MKTTPFLEYILYDIFGENEPITFRPMMGSFILYYEGRAFAIVSGEELYFKGTEEIGAWYLNQGSEQFTYIRKDEVAYLYYFSVPQEVYEERELLSEWLQVALSVALPPKPKKRKFVR
jgi:DNA transformation protein